MDGDGEVDVERASLLSVDTLVEKPSASGHALAAPSTSPTPLPKLQIAILLGIQLAEPISSMLILPFVNQLVQELGVTGGDDKKLGYYAGIIESMFFVAEAACVFQWGKLSDRIGRRPVLLLGVLGNIFAIILFGFSSKSYWTVILARAFAGATNGNLGVVKTVMGELTDSTNVAQGFALMPIIWSAGGTIGPFLGGTLSHPYERYPAWFSHPFWKEYPYSLPCFVAAGYAVIVFFFTLIFFQETRTRNRHMGGKEYHELSDVPDTPTVIEPSSPDSSVDDVETPSARALLRGPILDVVINYNLLALTEIAFGVLQPLIFATPVVSGGIGLSPNQIGIALAVYGVVNGVTQAKTFPWLLDRFGPKKLFMAGMVALTMQFTTFPIMQSLAALTNGANLAVWLVVCVQFLFAMSISSAYGTVNIFVVAVASRSALGATNGVVQTTTSCMRSVGPSIASSLYAWSAERNILDGRFAYLVYGIMGLVCLYASTRLPSNISRKNHKGYD